MTQQIGTAGPHRGQAKHVALAGKSLLLVKARRSRAVIAQNAHVRVGVGEAMFLLGDMRPVWRMLEDGD
ncbi:hypothetical protein ACN6A1_17515 [Myxococcus virescens]|uniref:hypothetical protein n=1 Tax=Myxococcus virescens TaxID=83456 RepID=UPI003DA3CCD1